MRGAARDARRRDARTVVPGHGSAAAVSDPRRPPREEPRGGCWWRRASIGIRHAGRGRALRCRQTSAALSEARWPRCRGRRPSPGARVGGRDDATPSRSCRRPYSDLAGASTTRPRTSARASRRRPRSSRRRAPRAPAPRMRLSMSRVTSPSTLEHVLASHRAHRDARAPPKVRARSAAARLLRARARSPPRGAASFRALRDRRARVRRLLCVLYLLKRRTRARARARARGRRVAALELWRAS